MSHKMLRPFIVKVSILGYFPLLCINIIRCIGYYVTLFNNLTSYNIIVIL